ncbi:type II secretion system protein [Streptomonospora arabica]
MTTTVIVTGVVGGLAVGAGAWMVLLAVGARAASARGGVRRLVGSRNRLVRLGAAGGAGLAGWILTGWPVAVALFAVGVWWLPALLGPDRAHTARVARIEAVASWSEQVRDLMAGASGLQQAITATAPIAPAPIREPVGRLADDLRTGRDPHGALAAFAHAVDTPTADLVAAALSSAVGSHAADLGALLSRLAEATREQAGMLVRVAAGRARVRTAMRIIIAVTMALAAGLVVFNPVYLEPYDSAFGQLVLVLIGGLWALALVWLARLARSDLGPRVLDPHANEKGAVAS